MRGRVYRAKAENEAAQSERGWVSSSGYFISKWSTRCWLFSCLLSIHQIYLISASSDLHRCSAGQNKPAGVGDLQVFMISPESWSTANSGFRLAQQQWWEVHGCTACHDIREYFRDGGHAVLRQHSLNQHAPWVLIHHSREVLLSAGCWRPIKSERCRSSSVDAVWMRWSRSVRQSNATG